MEKVGGIEMLQLGKQYFGIKLYQKIYRQDKGILFTQNYLFYSRKQNYY